MEEFARNKDGKAESTTDPFSTEKHLSRCAEPTETEYQNN